MSVSLDDLICYNENFEELNLPAERKPGYEDVRELEKLYSDV